MDYVVIADLNFEFSISIYWTATSDRKDITSTRYCIIQCENKVTNVCVYL